MSNDKEFSLNFVIWISVQENSKVQLPKTIKRNKEAIPKEDVKDILNQCSDIRLKTYVMLLAATGMCAVESLHIRVIDIDFENKPARISVMGENTKNENR